MKIRALKNLTLGLVFEQGKNYIVDKVEITAIGNLNIFVGNRSEHNVDPSFFEFNENHEDVKCLRNLSDGPPDLEEVITDEVATTWEDAPPYPFVDFEENNI